MSLKKYSSTVKAETNASDSEYPLTQLIIENRLDDLKRRVKEGANIEEKDNSGNYLTHTATQHNKINILKWLLLEKNISPNKENTLKKTILHIALEAELSVIIEWLIENKNKISLDITVNDLCVAIKAKNFTNVRVIANEISDISQENTDGTTAIVIAREYSDKKIESFLAKRVLFFILKLNNISEKQKLKKLKQQLDDQDGDVFQSKGKYNGEKISAVRLATQKNHMEIVQWLIKKGADPNSKDEPGADIQETSNVKEYSILLIGETGVGKSTFINAFVNYINYSSLDEAARSNNIYCLIPSNFTITDENYERQIITCGDDKNESFILGQSSTQSARSYSITTKSTVLRIIDTPGIGDTRGIEKDRENFARLLRVIGELKNIHAICIMLKPNNARLTVLFEYCIKEMFSHLDKSASQNIVFLFTNSRGTFYRPGDTLPPLLKVLKELEAEPTNVKILFNKDNVFCMDNEAFRFLLANQQKITFSDEEKEDFSASWNKSSQVCREFIEYMVKLEPHKIQNSVSINEARRLCFSFSKPLAEMAKNISENLSLLKNKSKLIEEFKGSVEELKSHLVIVLSTLQVKAKAPFISCDYGTCLKSDKVCYEPCPQNEIVPDQRGHKKLLDAHIMRAGDCTVCHHKYTHHIRSYYKSSTVIRETQDLNFENEVKKKKLEQKDIQRIIQKLKKKDIEYRKERDLIIEAVSKFTHFLKHHSIIASNDIFITYIEDLIQKEKKLDNLANTDVLQSYEEIKASYKRHLEDLEEQFRLFGRVSVLAKDVISEREKLYKLDEVGTIIKEITEVQMNSQKEDILADKTVIPANNILEDFLTSIK